MRIVFMGSPDFAVPSLEALRQAGHDIVLTVCQPDKPSGRGRAVSRCAVKVYAEEHGLPVQTPDKVRGKSAVDFIDAVQALKPDFVVVAAYGKILSTRLLSLARFGAINVHASLLPRWRGAAPIQHAILAGDAETGVSIMRMEAGLDTGPVYRVAKIPIVDDDTGGSLFDRLAQLGAETLVQTLPEIAAGRLPAQAQDDSLATFAPTLSKEDGHLNFSQSAHDLVLRVRAMHPWPGAFCYLNKKRLKVLRASVTTSSAQLSVPLSAPLPAPLPASQSAAKPGQLRIDGAALRVVCGQDLLEIHQLQVEGKKAMDSAAFIAGARLDPELVLT